MLQKPIFAALARVIVHFSLKTSVIKGPFFRLGNQILKFHGFRGRTNQVKILFITINYTILCYLRIIRSEN